MAEKFLSLEMLQHYDEKAKARMTNADTTTLQSAKEYTDTLANGAVKANTDALTVLNGTGDGSVDKKVADAVAKIVADAPESYDTLKEISDWISTHENDASAMNSAIQTNKTDIANLVKLIGTLPEGDASKTIVEYIDSKVGSIEFTAITEEEIDALFA